MELPPDPKSSSRDRFDQFAQRNVRSATHAQAPELHRLVEITKPEGYWVVLDIATGGGHTALKFSPFAKKSDRYGYRAGNVASRARFHR